MKRLPLAQAVLLGLVALPLVAHASDTSAPAAAPAPPSTDARLISQDELLARTRAQPAQTVVLDVRTPEEFAAGHVPGALNLPHDQIASHAGEIGKLREHDVIVYCRSGRRSELALDALHARGFAKLWHLEGDYLAWEAAGRPVERAPAPEAPATPASTP